MHTNEKRNANLVNYLNSHCPFTTIKLGKYYSTNALANVCESSKINQIYQNAICEQTKPNKIRSKKKLEELGINEI